jgi:hypothetical protein
VSGEARDPGNPAADDVIEVPDDLTGWTDVALEDLEDALLVAGTELQRAAQLRPADRWQELGVLGFALRRVEVEREARRLLALDRKRGVAA